MRTTAIFNLKGGVGKTLTAAVMADILAAEYRERVLLVDADGHGNLSQYFGVQATEDNSLLTLLQGGGEPFYGDFVSHARERIDFIPADISLMFADVDALQDGRCNLQALAELREAIEADAAQGEGYDFLLIDCPPAFSAASSAALAAADDVVIPVRLDAFSTAGMAELVRQVDNMRRINPRLRVAGVLATQYQRTPEEDAALSYLRVNSGLPIYKTAIRHSPKAPAATSSKEPLIVYSPLCGPAKDYRSFVAEYLEGGLDHGR